MNTIHIYLSSLVIHDEIFTYTIALGITIGTLVLLKIVQLFIVARIRRLAGKTKNNIDDAIIHTLTHVDKSCYIVLSLYAGIWYLHPSASIMRWVNFVVLLVLIISIAHACGHFIDFLIGSVGKNKSKEKNAAHRTSIMRVMKGIVMVGVWGMAVLLVLSNLGVNISAIITGLGIGGIAVALAIKNILGDVFSSFSILIDKPFIVGDKIMVEEKVGIVKYIGLKTTRIETSRGEELVIANQKLTNASIHNLTRMKERLDIQKIIVEYTTTQKKIDSIPQMVEESIKKMDGVEYIRCVMSSLGEYGIEFETAYVVNSKDINIFKQKRHDILEGIRALFLKEKIVFATKKE